MALRVHGVYMALLSDSSKLLTIIWHFRNRDIGLSNTVANNCLFESFEEIGGELNVCNIKKVLILLIFPTERIF